MQITKAAETMMIRMITESGMAAILDIGELKFLETDNERLLVLSCASGAQLRSLNSVEARDRGLLVEGSCDFV